ncbi:MAG TPA: fatty acid desaturase [Verrucomicrobiae bacterium]|nr:fatty acid desaturase [Verrucomicrobiae bacterium]
MTEELKSTKKTSSREAIAAWKAIVAEYQKPSRWRASWQLVNTVGAYAALWYLMYLSLSVSWWLTVPMAIVAGGLLIRVFIIFHDCGHGSFFKSRWANDFWGFITGMLTFTPYYHWRWEHSLHHATAGDLDRRGVGDVWTLTVQEYLDASRWKKFSYRLVRNPFVLFVIAPLFLFLIRQRFPSPNANPRERLSVWLMNLAVVCQAAVLISIFGFLPWLIIQLIAMGVAGSGGIWMFYVQHQFEDAYWERSEDWDYTDAALKGSSFYKLPKVLQWFSGNIGFHHIHHLSPRIPNYNLERCHRSDPMLQEVKPITLWSSLKSITFRLWDESSRKLVGFGHLKKHRKEPGKAQTKERDEGNGENEAPAPAPTPRPQELEAGDEARQSTTSVGRS